jgi:hypothetical protein
LVLLQVQAKRKKLEAKLKSRLIFLQLKQRNKNTNHLDNQLLKARKKNQKSLNSHLLFLKQMTRKRK